MDESAHGSREVALPHQRRPNEKCVDLGAKGADILMVPDPGFTDDKAVGRYPRGEASRHSEIDREGPQVPIVDSDDGSIEPKCPVEFVIGMDLSQGLDTGIGGGRATLLEGRIIEGRKHQEHRVRSGDSRLEHLIGVHHEILAEHGAGDQPADGPEIVARSLEKWAVGEHRNGIRNWRVGIGYFIQIERRTNLPLRWR
jgi:hypothetical protein